MHIYVESTLIQQMYLYMAFIWKVEMSRIVNSLFHLCPRMSESHFNP